MQGKKNHNVSVQLGSAPIPGLLWRLALPSSLGLLALALCQAVDTIFVGRYVGTNGIAAIAVVMPVILLFSSVGRGLGVGGAAIVSRCLGKGEYENVRTICFLLTCLCLFATVSLGLVGLGLIEPLLYLFGGKGELYPLCRDYFLWLLPGLPCLGLIMLANHLVRAQGRAQHAMMLMVIPAVINALLDSLFISYFQWGIKGAAVATSLSYLIGLGFGVCFLGVGRSFKGVGVSLPIGCRTLLREVCALGSVPVLCQGSAMLVALFMNNLLLACGGETAMASYGIVQRLFLLLLLPMIGLSQGFIPICGYSQAAGMGVRVQELIKYALSAGIFIATVVAVLLSLSKTPLLSIFTFDQMAISQSRFALAMIALSLPLLAVQFVCAAYFQALGEVFSSLFLTLLRQGLLLVPFALLLSSVAGTFGVWAAFPLSALLACLVALKMAMPRWKLSVNNSVSGVRAVS